MLSTTFKTYKEKFAEIMTIFKPLIVIGVVVNIFSLFLTYLEKGDNFVLMIVLGIILIILFIIQWLIYSPATFRTIQIREMGEITTIQDGVLFQKNNTWNYFMLTAWISLYSVGYAIISVVPITVSVFIGVFFISKFTAASVISGTLIMLTGSGFCFYLIYKNYSKIFFATNIYLTKNLEARECMRESVRLGKAYRNKIWGYFTGVIMIAFVGFILIIIPMFFNYKVFITNTDPSFTFSLLMSLWQFVVNLLFVMPLTYIYMSKAYIQLTEFESSLSVLPVDTDNS